MAKSLLERTARWAWTRDETRDETTAETIRYTVTLYSVAFGLTLTAGMLLWVYGNQALGFSILIFGTWFTAFMGAVNIGWELLKFRAENREPSTEEQGPERELAPDYTVKDDTVIGFVVTVFGIVALILAYQLAIFITSTL
ncbi:MAG: hypothetical protein ABEH59_08365 [Halobacteriales archaeon]